MTTHDRLKRRVGLETVLAGLTALLTLLTLISREWIEALTGVDPDRHSGALEWLIVAVLVAVTLALAARARRDWVDWRTLPA